MVLSWHLGVSGFSASLIKGPYICFSDLKARLRLASRKTVWWTSRPHTPVDISMSFLKVSLLSVFLVAFLSQALGCRQGHM